MIKINNLITYNDAPEPWGLFFQDNATLQMEPLEELHNNIMFYLAIILFAVSWIMLSIILNYRNAKISNEYSYKIFVECFWTITPALILVLIVFPSFKLLYLMDEVIDPSLVIYGEGHQWYWSYQYPDFTNNGEECFEFYMNNSGINNNRGTFTNTIRELLNPEPVIVYHYTHGTLGFNLANFHELDRDARAAGFFQITDINVFGRVSCTVSYFGPVPNLDTAEARLLGRLVNMFPHGDGYVHNKLGSILEDYRLQGCIQNALDRANANPGLVNVCDQHMPANLGPRYNPNAAQGTYKPWAGEIARSLSRHREAINDPRSNSVILDRNSTLFYLTFRNAHRFLSATKDYGPTILALEEL